jgi:hypothetical protein
MRYEPTQGYKYFNSSNNQWYSEQDLMEYQRFVKSDKKIDLRTYDGASESFPALTYDSLGEFFLEGKY